MNITPSKETLILIWRKFMDAVLKNSAVEQFPKYEVEDAGKPVLNGTLNANDKIEVCKINKNNYCLATDACPKSSVEKKKFVSAHSILYYLNKDDPRGDPPKSPDDDPQFNNWEKAVQKYAKDNNKDFSGDTAPTKDCKSSDFDSYKPSISIDSPDDGSTQDAPFTIKVSASADAGIKKISLSINGNEVSSVDRSSLSYDYSKSGSDDLKIEAEVKDNDGNTDSTSIKVTVNIL